MKEMTFGERAKYVSRRLKEIDEQGEIPADRFARALYDIKRHVNRIRELNEDG